MKRQYFKGFISLSMCMIIAVGLCACGGHGAKESSLVSDSSTITSGESESSNSMESDAEISSESSVSSTLQSSAAGSNPAASSSKGSSKVTSSITPKTLPVKDMKGRQFVFCAPSWEILDVEEPWMKELAKKYNCNFKNLQLSDYTTLYSSILAGDPIADVMVMGDSNFYQSVQKKFLRDLTVSPYINVKDSSLYVTAVNKITTVNNKIYGVARDNYPIRRILAYNKTLITGADDLQTLSKSGKLTWSKLFDILKKVKAGGAAGIAGQMFESDVLETFIEANGGRIFTRDGGLKFTYTLTSTNTRDAISYVQNLYKSGCIMSMNGGNYQYPQSQFAKGKVGVLIADSWNLSYVYSKAKFDIGLALVPAGNNATSPLVEQTVFECYSIPNTVKNPSDVELIFAAWVKAADSNGEGKNHFMDEWADIINDDNNMNVLKQYVSIIDSGKAVIDYKNAVTNLYNDGLYDYQQKVLMGEISAQSYLESVEAVYKAKAADFNS